MDWCFVEMPSVHVRRVGFRHGTDDELGAMHVVESEVETERWPGRIAQPFESYAAFARSLPSQFDDHTWLAATSDGVPAGCSACWTNAAGDTSVMESYVYVRRAWRRHGIGARLWHAVLDAAATEGRSSITWRTYDTIPAGEAFSRQIGGHVVRVNRTSELALADVDWSMVAEWIDGGAGRAAGYQLQFWDGPYSDDLRNDAATFHHIMQTAPRDDLEMGDVMLDADDVAELDRALIEAGRERWTIFVRTPTGACVGGTEVVLEPWDPGVALQQNTAVDPDHRGLGLAKWAKGAMLERVRTDRPDVTHVHTGNAFSNDPMLAINDALGFRVTDVSTEWQVSVR
jgi:GNAT superfamily N-acetyltransferase